LSLWLLLLSAGCDPQRLPGADAGQAPDASVDAGLDGGAPLDTCAQVTPSAPDLENYAALLVCLRDAAALGAAKDMAIATFVDAVETHDGFPLVGEGKVVFVYVKDARFDVEVGKRAEEHFDLANRGDPLRVAGDFNTWDATAAPLTAEDRGFYHRALPLAPAAQRWGYKFIAKGGGADVWFSDPLSRRFDYDSNGRLSVVRGGDAQGHLEWMRSVHAAQLAVDRPIYMYVPRGYDSSAAAAKRYPVLYMHDGNNLFDVDQPRAASATWDVDAVAEAEITAGRAREFIVVGVPNNDNRFGEYTHTTDVVGGSTVGGDGDKYVDFLVSDLKPLVDQRYRTQPGRESTGILGSSLGGLISYYAGLKKPAVFKYVGGMSSTFDWGNPTVISLYGLATDLASRDQVFYLDSGGAPPATGPCKFDGFDDSADNYCETLAMKAQLEALGVNRFPLDPDASPLMPANINVMHWWTSGAPHFETAWHDRLHRVMRLFFRP
jgi:predicted alpha/beta superfamily hydrolase